MPSTKVKSSTAETDDSELSQPDTEPLPFDEDDQDAIGDDEDADGEQEEVDEGLDQTARANAFLAAAASMDQQARDVAADDPAAETSLNDSAPPSTASPSKPGLIDDFSGESDLTEEEGDDGAGGAGEGSEDDLPGTQPGSPSSSVDESDSDSDRSGVTAADGEGRYASARRAKSGGKSPSGTGRGTSKNRSSLRRKDLLAQRSNRADSRASTADVQEQLEDEDSDINDSDEEDDIDAEEEDEAASGLAALATEGGPGAPAGLAGLAALAAGGATINDATEEGYSDEDGETGVVGSTSDLGRIASAGDSAAPNANLTSSSSTATVKGKKGRGASMIANAPLLIVDPAVDEDGASRIGSDDERDEDVPPAEEEEEEEEPDKGVETPAVDPDEEVPAEDDTAQRRVEALETLAAIEIKLAALRDRLYLERIEEVKKEGEMILNGTHPELIHLTHLIDARRERRMRLVEVWLENEERQFENTAKAEEEATWSVWKDETANLRRTMMDDTATKKRRLDREKRSLDVPQPPRRHQIFQTELIPNPAYEGRQLVAHAAARRAMEAEKERERGRGRRRGKRKDVGETFEEEEEQARYDLAILESLGVNAENRKIGEYVAYPDLRGAEEGDAWADLEQMGIHPQAAYGYYRPEQDVSYARYADNSNPAWDQQQAQQVAPRYEAGADLAYGGAMAQQHSAAPHPMPSQRSRSPPYGLQQHHEGYALQSAPGSYDEAHHDYYSSRPAHQMSRGGNTSGSHRNHPSSHANSSNGRVKKEAVTTSASQGSRKRPYDSQTQGLQSLYTDTDVAGQHSSGASSYPRPPIPSFLQQAEPHQEHQQAALDRGQLSHGGYTSAYQEATVPRATPADSVPSYPASASQSARPSAPVTTETTQVPSMGLHPAFPTSEQTSSRGDVKMEDGPAIDPGPSGINGSAEI